MKNIKKLRYQLGMTQQQLADKLGLTKSHISFLEKDSTRTISKCTVEKMADILGCSVSYLYGMENFKIEPETDEEKIEIINFLIENLESEELKDEFSKKFKQQD
jgi:transcriptional regulator with XRE-family HTH domain